jgi:hypothetical protein
MTETQERETELVVGTIGGITQKKADTWTVQVTREGSQYAKNLWTKDAELVESLSTKFGQIGAFVGGLGKPYMVNGKEVQSWWIESVDTNPVDHDGAPASDNAAEPATIRHNANASPKSGSEMSKEEWARKDSAIHKMACIKTAADALKHTLPSDPSADDMAKYLSRVAQFSTAWHRSVLAERDDPTGEDVPF